MEARVSEEAKANPGAAFGHTLRRIERNKINSVWLAFRNSAAVALPLAVGLAFGNPLGSVAVATGALNVSFADGTDPYGQRARRMLAWSVLGAVAVFIGSLAGIHPLAAVLVAMTWAFIAGMLIGISARAGDLGLNTLVALIVFEARGVSTLEGAFYTGLLVLGGGLLQTLLAVLFWPVRRSAPERRVVGRVFLDLAQEVDPNSDTAPSALSSPHVHEQEALDALARDHSVTAERFLLLFDQADRLRLSTYALKRLRDELGEGENQRSEAEGDTAADLDSLLALTSGSLAAAGNCLLSDSAAPDFPAQLEQLQTLIERAHDQKRVAAFPLANNIAAATDVLGGQLRLVMQLAQHATPEGEAEYFKRELKQPFKLQLAGWVATLRANVHPQSAVFRHAIRLALCIGLGDMIERSISWERAYWLPMTIAVVLKPDFTATFSRGVLRLLGTLGGLALATVLYHLVPDSAFNELLLVGGFTFFLRWLGPANYGVLTIAVSGLVVFLIAILGVSPADVITARGLNTAAGGILALIAYAMWPTWERTQVSEAMASMFDASRLYFRAVMRRLSSDDPDIRRTLDEARREWRRKRSSAEASVDRVSAEPGTTDSTRTSLAGMLASSHALVNAIMGLEAGTIETEVHTPGAALQTFANDVEFTLYYLSAALRGSPSASRNLPALREDHRRLVEARRNFADQDEYVSIETDRLTVSLNTLREQVTRYLSGSGK